MEITAEYIYKNINDTNCIIVINNNVYNVTEYLTKHPGGKNILISINGSDATTEFNNLRHSDKAKELLETFKIGSINIAERSKLKKTSDNNESVSTISLGLIKERLVTHEDKFHIHEIAGTVALLNMVYRSYENIFLSNHTTYVNPNILNNITLLCHVILAISSLMFHISEKRTIAGKNFEYKEQRLHTIIFSLRSLSPILLQYVNIFDSSNYLHRLINILVWHSLADITTKVYYDNDNGTTIRNGKGRNGKNINKIYRNFASISQIIAISVLLGLNNNKYDFKNNYNDIIFLIVIPIQLNTFLLTLYKKNFISSEKHIILYGLSLAVLYSQLQYGDKQFIVMTMLMILLRFQKVNKYVLYISFSLIAEFMRKNNITIPTIISVLTSIIFSYNIIKNSLEYKKDLSLAVLSKEKITDDTYLIKFLKGTTFPLVPNGHHIIITFNDLSRPYTPIKDDNKTLELYIKEYKEGRMSNYLANLNTNDIVNVSNIMGHNTYRGNGVFTVRERDVSTTDCINAICIGTGITPIIRIIEDSSIKINIIHCIRDKKDILPEKILKKTNNISIYNHLSNEKGRITSEIIKEKLNMNNNVILVCGTKNFNEEMETLLTNLSVPKKLIILY